MISYSCTFSIIGKKPTTTACWGNLNYGTTYVKDAVIIIDKYVKEDTKAYINTIVGIINEIQPCKLITQDGVEYISYKLIGRYNNDILLLNFIRNLWYDHCPGYSLAFFKALEELKKDKKLTAMEKLTTANVAAVKACGQKGYGHHSNCHEDTKVRTLPKNYYTKTITATRDFLCD